MKRNHKLPHWLVLVIFFLITFIYAFLRYNIFGETPMTDIPTVIVNKAISFTLTIWLLYAYWKFYTSDNIDVFHQHYELFRKMIFIHIFLSLLIMCERLIPKFFGSQSYTLWGGLSLLAGVLASSLLSYSLNKTFMFIFLLLFKMHLFFMGFQGWLKPQSWPGYMPPITLICFIIVLITDYIILKTTFPEQSKP